jgi:hypothetical protein
LEAFGRVVFVWGVEAGGVAELSLGGGEVGEEAEAPGADALRVWPAAVERAERMFFVG